MIFREGSWGMRQGMEHRRCGSCLTTAALRRWWDEKTTTEGAFKNISLDEAPAMRGLRVSTEVSGIAL